MIVSRWRPHHVGFSLLFMTLVVLGLATLAEHQKSRGSLPDRDQADRLPGAFSQRSSVRGPAQAAVVKTAFSSGRLYLRGLPGSLRHDHLLRSLRRAAARSQNVIGDLRRCRRSRSVSSRLSTTSAKRLPSRGHCQTTAGTRSSRRPGPRHKSRICLKPPENSATLRGWRRSSHRDPPV